jgi:hypothetical protein
MAEDPQVQTARDKAAEAQSDENTGPHHKILAYSDGRYPE